ICCFFFQAEDGIRDRNVTGVQTCALPISLAIQNEIINEAKGKIERAKLLFIEGDFEKEDYDAIKEKESERIAEAKKEIERLSVRSEERRVGKECRARWERDHNKKNIDAVG